MPGNLLNADISFPDLTKGQSTDEKFRLVTNYLYMLLEQLRYSFGNIGVENFNESELDSLVNLITEPIYVQLSDEAGNIASLTATAEQLISRMTDAEGNISTLQQTSTSLMSQVTDLEGNVSTLQQTSQSLSSRITNAEGDISSLTQTVNGFTLSVTNGTESSVIRLMSGSAQISSATIQMTGLVTFTDLSGNGTTVINGNNITTGTIDADRINMTGAITWSDLSYGVQSDINGAYTAAQNAQDAAEDASSAVASVNSTVNSWRYGGTTYIDGGSIMTGTVTASTLRGGLIGILNSNGTQIGYISVGSSTSTGLQFISGGNLYMESASCSLQMTGRNMSVSCDNFCPSGTAANLGNSSLGMWQAVYSYTAEIQTSDENIKHDIAEIPQKYLDMMDDITPVIYKMDNGTSNRYHTGFIAQNVKEAMDAHGVSDLELAAWCKDVDAQGNELQMLRYVEFIAIMWAKIRQQDSRIKELEAKING